MLLQPLLTISSAYRVHTFERKGCVPSYLCQSYFANEKHTSKVDWSSEVIPSHLSLSLYDFNTATNHESIERAEKMAIIISNLFHITIHFNIKTTHVPPPSHLPRNLFRIDIPRVPSSSFIVPKLAR